MTIYVIHSIYHIIEYLNYLDDIPSESSYTIRHKCLINVCTHIDKSQNILLTLQMEQMAVHDHRKQQQHI